MKTIRTFAELDLPEKYKATREDYRLIEYAVNLGWIIDASKNEQKGLTFIKGCAHVWATKHGWQVADLVDGSYQNHRPAESLAEALHSIPENLKRFKLEGWARKRGAIGVYRATGTILYGRDEREVNINSLTFFDWRGTPKITEYPKLKTKRRLSK